jgi:MFS family permease
VIGFYIFYNLVYALSSYPIGWLFDRVGKSSILIAGFTLFALAYGIFSIAGSLWTLILVFIIYGLYASSTEGISKAMITNLAKKEQTATALGFYTSMASLCTLLASTISGILWTIWSLKVMFLVSATGAVLVTIYFLFYFRFTKRHPAD